MDRGYAAPAGYCHYGHYRHELSISNLLKYQSYEVTRAHGSDLP